MTHDAEILIVEDSRTQAERLRYLLETSGYAVAVAADANAALAALRERVPGLVVTDIVMPGMDGYELCERIKSDETLRDVPVILLTTLSEPQDVIRSLQCGADNFIRKPYDDAYLLTRIGNILTGRALRERGRMGVEVYLSGERHFITAERQQILDFLLSTYEEVVQINDELQLRAAEVEAKNAELEARQAELERALLDLDAQRRRVEEHANINRAVLDATVDGIVLADAAGTPLLWNAAYTRLTSRSAGMSPGASVAETVEAVAVADPAALRAFMDSLEADPEREGRLDLDLPNAELSLRLFTAPVRDGSSSLIGRIFVLRDMTRERQAERLKSELVATVSHELRTPLAGVLGFAELLLTRELDDATRKRYAETIAVEARRLADLVTDFLDLQRIEEGRFELSPVQVDLGDVVRRQLAVFSQQSAAHRLSANLPEGPLPVLGEEDRLSQVIANLLSNAIKYSPAGGPVEVSAREYEGLVEIAVSDSGLGIPADIHAKIFSKFFRVDSSDTRDIGGTGLGLALCREIVEAHGGQIGFESVEGGGSTFWFRLPTNRTVGAAPEVRARTAV